MECNRNTTKAESPFNIANLRKLNKTTKEEYLAIFDHNERFQSFVRDWLYENEKEYYFEEIFSHCFDKCCDWYENIPGDPRFRLDNQINGPLCAKFIDGIQKAQRNYCLLPDGMEPELEILYKLRDSWGNCTDDEQEDEIVDTMQAMCENFADIIQEIVTQAFNYYTDHPDEIRNNIEDFIEYHVGENEYYDCTTFEIYRCVRIE